MMVGSRTVTAIAGIVLSLLVSFLVYHYTNSLLLFLFVPFVPFLFRRGSTESREQPPVKECPRCDFHTTGREYEYCPRDGSRLESDREY